MDLHLRSAGRAVTRPAGHRRAGPALLLAAGLVSLVAGAAVGLDFLAPVFGGETSTMATAVVAPLASAPTVISLPAGEGSVTGLGSGVITDGPVNGVAFEMSVPAVGYQATVLEGVSKTELDRGPGHYPDSAWPGKPGNVAVAAHNVYWLSFSRLRAGDLIDIRTAHGHFVYQVTGSTVVNPDDGSVLAQTPEHRLTLTTCYPLWAGAFAKQRLIFFATELVA